MWCGPTPYRSRHESLLSIQMRNKNTNLEFGPEAQPGGGPHNSFPTPTGSSRRGAGLSFTQQEVQSDRAPPRWWSSL